jgi:hypothetical protein
VGLSVLLSLASCSAPTDDPLIVWSNVSDTAFFVERYNLVSDTPVHFRYIENLTETLTQETIEADLVIGRWVNTPGVNTRMTPIGGKGSTDTEGARALRSRSGSPGQAIAAPFAAATSTWIPLSYNLPAVVYATEHFRMEPSFAVTFTGLSDALRPTAANSEPPPVFAPTASRDGMYAIYRSLGFSPGVDEAGTPQWQRRDLQRAIDTVTQWLTDQYGSPEEERAYVRDFLYDPPVRRIEANRTGAVYQDSATLFSWSFLEDRRLDFRWLADDQQRIAVTDNIVYAGIPADSDAPSAATALLKWLTTPAVQVELVEAKVTARIDTFGFFDGFSTIPDVNTEMIHVVYPQLTGRVPAPGVLTVPTTQPRYWNEAVERIVAPFFARPGDASVLEQEIRRWYLQRGD